MYELFRDRIAQLAGKGSVLAGKIEDQSHDSQCRGKGKSDEDKASGA